MSQELFDEMLDLRARDVSMQVRLPRLVSPDLEDLRSAVDDVSVGAARTPGGLLVVSR